jgi:hypothetical protein
VHDTWHIVQCYRGYDQVAYCGVSTLDENFPRTRDYLTEFEHLESELRHFPEDQVCGACLLLHLEGQHA